MTSTSSGVLCGTSKGSEKACASGLPGTTPVGTMKGSYFMQADDGRQFDAPIAEFTLAMPRTLH